ncbi:MAG: XTP/dITP diphosphatase [Candidatus Altiarchaeota archaeon]|nr:XTP/dITP diphosphatase [Candidatus Altiarchaeota archaeon]
MRVKFATSNRHKVQEGNVVGGEYGIEFIQLKEPYPEIRDDDVREVAREGAGFVYDKVKFPVIVEDTGLFIESLKGFPGSYSAFVYGKIGCEGILRLLSGIEDRKAWFTSAIGFCDESGVRIFVGEARGTISEEARGNAGFGYDPIFVPGGYEKTFAEDPQLKNQVSHRRKAFQKFCQWISSR